jgi:hypothetical protein
VTYCLEIVLVHPLGLFLVVLNYTHHEELLIDDNFSTHANLQRQTFKGINWRPLTQTNLTYTHLSAIHVCKFSNVSI